MINYFSIKLLYGLAVFLIAVIWVWTTEQKSRSRPPGPKPIPLLGNMHQLPLEYQHHTFKKWSASFGELIHARLFRTEALILNSQRVAQDLLQNQGSSCSGRPRAVLYNEMMGYHIDFAFMQYGERWRKQRRMAHVAFQTNNRLLSYRALQRREAHALVMRLYENPNRYKDHVSTFAAAAIFDVVYGYRINSCNDEWFDLAEKALRVTVEAGSPAATLVDFFPFLQHLPSWFPGSKCNQKTLEARKFIEDAAEKPFQICRRAIASGEANTSWVASMLAEHMEDGVLSEADEEDIKGVAMGCNLGELCITATVLLTFLLAMVLHPGVFAKAQQEMDRITGRSRLPDFDDRESLPYLECVIREVYRWNPPAPLGIPHATTEEVTYRGFNIPAGTMLVQNLWAMMQDAEIYPQPEKFYPERFEKMGANEISQKDTRKIVFGFGRRACPGRQFADSSVWLAAASMIATMDIGKACDANGRTIDPTSIFLHGFVSRPKDFMCSIRPRSDSIRELIHRTQG
ncbi:cytochrome P450 [Laetiporus sulphureus 93-53]|uniref:Cytochrome P450 n=1 Tax=Laetiporus sulphureus 93-53 TaxID=1314785 RepID=A0A165D4B7_9APHY|nr:cytochrome P450 [Laetiporus sulphureus 93-53]KZT04131.1 cytochrome P450 [Laetiporus sulphureus 93-53]